jgi:hypothetical protein
MRVLHGLCVALLMAAPLAVATTSPNPLSAQSLFEVTYPPGWNLVAAPRGTLLTGMTGPLLTLQGGDADYQPIAPGLVARDGSDRTTSPTAGLGYWAYFAQPTTITLAASFPLPNPGGSGGTVSRFLLSVSAARGVMIGNPYAGPVSVAGADVVYTYAPGQGYSADTTIGKGHGAFVYAAAGAELTICPVQVTCQ